jgi:cobalamin-dependent methionine synthase I
MNEMSEPTDFTRKIFTLLGVDSMRALEAKARAATGVEGNVLARILSQFDELRFADTRIARAFDVLKRRTDAQRRQFDDGQYDIMTDPIVAVAQQLANAAAERVAVFRSIDDLVGLLKPAVEGNRR